MKYFKVCMVKFKIQPKYKDHTGPMHEIMLLCNAATSHLTTLFISEPEKILKQELLWHRLTHIRMS